MNFVHENRVEWIIRYKILDGKYFAQASYENFDEALSRYYRDKKMYKDIHLIKSIIKEEMIK